MTRPESDVLRLLLLLRLLAATNERRSGDVSLAALATLGHRSPFSLHRLFLRVTGETPKAYTARVRLTRAAADLRTTRHTVAEIAFGNGFGSHEVFTRAFVRQFGVTPSAYRADGRWSPGQADVVTASAPCVGLYRVSTSAPSFSRLRKAPPMEIFVKDQPEMHALVMRRRISRDEIAATLAEFLPKVFGYAVGNGLAMAGPPFARYPELGMGSLVIEAGVHLAAPPPDAPGDGIEVITIPAGPAAVTIHRGPYDTLPDTYRAVESWLDQEGRTPSGPPREVYVTDPGDHPDPATWETEVIQPLS